MQRRTVLATLGSLVTTAGLAGCIGDDGGGTATESPTASRTPSETPNPYEMSEGTVIVEVYIETGYGGEVVLNAGCRDGETVLTDGEYASIERRDRGERCAASVSAGDEALFDRNVAGSESVDLTVTAEGELERSITVV